MSTEGNLRFKIDWANLLVGSNFTVFALFYFVFEGNFPREAYIWTTSSPGRSSLALEVGRPHLQRPRKSALGTRLIFGGRFNGGRWADGQMGFLRYRFWRLIFGGAYFRNLTVLSKSGAASVQVYPLLSLHYTFSYFYDPHEETLLSSILPLTARAKIEPDVSKDAGGLLEREALERGILSEGLIMRRELFRLHGSFSWAMCSQLQRHLPNKMVRTKGILLVTTFLCFLGVISATCPSSTYSDLKDTLQSPGFNSTRKYPPNQNCTYNIRVSAGRRIILAFDFEVFDIRGSMPSCSQDSLEIIVG